MTDEQFEWVSDLFSRVIWWTFPGNNKPDHVRYTPIWNKYLKNNCQATMTKEEALKQEVFYLSKDQLKEDVALVEEYRKQMLDLMREEDREKGSEFIAQTCPYEALFVMMPM